MTPATFPCLSCGADTTSETPCAKCGASPVVCGAYKLVAKLGGGGMGVVYEARRQPDDVRVAVKVVRLRDTDGFAGRDMFEESTRVLQNLEHPGLPKVYDFAEDDGARLLLVREVFDGSTLEERVKKEHRRLRPKEFRALLRSLLELLDYLHGLVPPVIHRDIKPANVMFRTRADSIPVLVDFDTVAAPAAKRTGLTVVGTLGYAAPEQLYGEASAASDLYSLGCTMLFVATHTDVTDLERNDGRFDVERLAAELDPGTRRVLAKLCEPERSTRYRSARVALDDLDAAERALLALSAPRSADVAVASSTRPLTEAERRSRKRRQGPMGLVIAGIIAFSIVGGGVGMWVAGRGIKVRKGELATPAPAADAKRALCWILSEPKGADVFVGEQHLGKTPAQLDVFGMRVRLEMEGKKSFQGEARCGELVFLASRPGMPAPVVPPPAAAPPVAPAPPPAPVVSPSTETVKLRIGSKAPGADVTLDGNRAGKTPFDVRVGLGAHELRFEQAGKTELRKIHVMQDVDVFVSF